MRTELVERKRWISQRRFLHLLNYCMLLPGPEAQRWATRLALPDALNEPPDLFARPVIDLARRVQRDAVAFGIDDDGAKAVRPDLLTLVQDTSAVGAHGFDRFIQPSFHREINQRPVGRRSIIDAAAVAAHDEATGRVLFLVRQKAVLHSALRPSFHLARQHGGIELDCSIEIRDRNIGPTERVSRHFRS